MRIGLSMRVVQAQVSNVATEGRDAISHDWESYLCRQQHHPILIPNVLWEPERFFEENPIDLLVLTGGDDIGERSTSLPLRDQRETQALDLAIGKRIPVLGVCRGLQLINQVLGGDLARGGVDAQTHVAREHEVRFHNGFFEKWTGGRSMSVNSYHGHGIRPEQLAPNLIPLALSPDGFVEAARHATHRVLGVMWHPERPFADPRAASFHQKRFFESLIQEMETL